MSTLMISLLLLFFVFLVLSVPSYQQKQVNEPFQSMQNDETNRSKSDFPVLPYIQSPLKHLEPSRIELFQGYYSPSVEQSIRSWNQFRLLSFPIPLHTISRPPRHLSSQTLKEMKTLMNIMHDSTWSEKRQAFRDLRHGPEDETSSSLLITYRNDTLQKITDPILRHFIVYAGTHGLIYNISYLNELSQEIEWFADKLKIIYHRPRPYQIAYLFGWTFPVMDFHSFDDTTETNNNNISSWFRTSAVNSPSFPSKLYLKAKLYSLVLQENNKDPDIKQGLHDIEQRIRLATQIVGFHFSSDLDVVDEIVPAMKSHIRFFMPRFTE